MNNQGTVQSQKVPTLKLCYGKTKSPIAEIQKTAGRLYHQLNMWQVPLRTIIGKFPTSALENRKNGALRADNGPIYPHTSKIVDTFVSADGLRFPSVCLVELERTSSLVKQQKIQVLGFSGGLIKMSGQGRGVSQRQALALRVAAHQDH